MKLDSKYFDRIRTRRKREQPPEAQAPVCQWDGCDKPGVHRAPVGRNAEGKFFMFCFEHVKDYNKGYNYFSGLSDSEIARYQKEAITGHRPTWTVGVNGPKAYRPSRSTPARHLWKSAFALAVSLATTSSARRPARSG